MTDERDYYQRRPDIYDNTGGSGIIWPVLGVVAIILLIALFFAFSGGPENGVAPPDMAPTTAPEVPATPETVDPPQ